VSEVLSSPAAMFEWEQKIGGRLHAGDLIILTGALGAGKTALTQGIGKALGITGITSPTFVISRIHVGKVRLVHVDAYRLKDSSAALFDDLDLESMMESSVVVIEWGAEFVHRLSENYLEINLEHGLKENDRILSMIGYGSRFESFAV
jgi:tRNA threonylcarbamoyladenosine biosynthesis protein TsaE